MPTLAGVVAIVDDDACILRALQRSLSAYGYRVKVFASAEQYLVEADPAEIGCTVIDIDLGAGLSGLALGEEISSSVHATPIVFMSGSHHPVLCQRAKAIGCLEFLEKPFLASRLIAAIMRLDRRDC